MKKLNEREVILLSSLRSGGKKNVLQIAKQNKIPKSTLFDTLYDLEKNNIFDYRAYLDFEKIGFSIKIFYVIKTNLRCKNKLRYYLKDKRNVNSLYDLGLGLDFLFEGIFKNFKEVDEFEKDLDENFEIFEKQTFNVIENVKYENFLTNKEDFGGVN
jgi:DNA-binding Lrp family transcriptional regulator